MLLLSILLLYYVNIMINLCNPSNRETTLIHELSEELYFFETFPQNIWTHIKVLSNLIGNKNYYVTIIYEWSL